MYAGHIFADSIEICFPSITSFNLRALLTVGIVVGRANIIIETDSSIGTNALRRPH